VRKNGLLMPETPDRPRRTGLFALDFVIAASAIVISFASLWVALRADRTQEQLLQASVWPYIEFYASGATETGGERLAFGLRNAGVGPAIVQSFALEYNGHPYPRLRELLAACCQVPAGHHPGILSSTVHDSVIMAHEDFPFIEVYPGKTDSRTYAAIEAARFHIGIKICYCSVLGDCWFFDSKHDEHPEAVRKCEPAKVPYLT
jgi:hypothetical protein